MANWCKNSLTITGNHKLLTQFVACAFTKTPCDELGIPVETSIRKPNGEAKPTLSFQTTVPVPVQIQKTAHDRTMCIGDGKMEIRPYDCWLYENWGCLIDIYRQGLTPESMGWSDESTQLKGFFETIYRPPICWVKKTAELFPYLTFQMFYHEFGWLLAGEVIAKGEEFVHTPWSRSQCERLFYGDQGETEQERSSD